MGSRQPITGKRPRSIKPNKARRVIRKYHVLLKQKQTGSAEVAAAAEAEMKKIGGLEVYQKASLCGQSWQRGGDSSAMLLEWLKNHNLPASSLLEVGSLSIDNACSRSPKFTRIARIDLNSQHPQIEQQDFMERPTGELFGCISLSLVLNFVDSSERRGDMLMRTRRFLVAEGLLFVVLPLPCVTNSRYFSWSRFIDVATSCGFEVIEKYATSKLAYWLLRKLSNAPCTKVHKKLVHDGFSRNNFCIIIN